MQSSSKGSVHEYDLALISLQAVPLKKVFGYVNNGRSSVCGEPCNSRHFSVCLLVGCLFVNFVLFCFILFCFLFLFLFFYLFVFMMLFFRAKQKSC